MRTQLRAFGAFTGGRYGSFAGKSVESHPVGVLTQPRGYGAFTGKRFGSFAGKGGAAGTHPVGRLTQLRGYGAFTGRRFGSFAGRAAVVVPDVGGGGSWGWAYQDSGLGRRIEEVQAMDLDLITILIRMKKGF